MVVILDIVKVIGMMILVMLAIILLLVFSVLFVPIKYQLRAEYDTSFQCNIKITWLLHLLGIKVLYENQRQAIVFLFLGIPIWDSRKPLKKKKTKRKNAVSNKKKEDSILKKEEKYENFTVKSDENKEEKVYGERHFTRKDPAENENIGEKVKKNTGANVECKDGEKLYFIRKISIFYDKMKNIFYRIIGLFRNIKYTFERICDRIKVYVDNITYYKELWQDVKIQKAIGKIKKWLLHFWKNVKPRQFLAHITFGFDDPAIVADILGIYSVLYPWIGQNVIVFPDFENVPVKGDLFLKGRVTLYLFACAIWKYLFDKNIKYLKRRVVREES